MPDVCGERHESDQMFAKKPLALCNVWRLAWSVSPSPDANVGVTASWGADDQCLSLASRAAFLRRTTREKAAAEPQLGALVARCLGHVGSVWTAELATPFAAPSPTCG